MVTRTRRSSFERKCLSKSAKRLFHGMGRQVFKLLVAVDKPAKRKAEKQDATKNS